MAGKHPRAQGPDSWQCNSGQPTGSKNFLTGWRSKVDVGWWMVQSEAKIEEKRSTLFISLMVTIILRLRTSFPL